MANWRRLPRNVRKFASLAFICLPPNVSSRQNAHSAVQFAEASLAVLIVEQAFQTLELLGDLALARDQGEHVDDQDQPSGQEAVKHECEIACVHLISVK